jgi:hypothetical protein
MDHFVDISARFDEVDARFDRVDARLEHFSVFSQSFDAKIEGLFARQGWRLMGMMIALVAVLLAGVGVLG